MGFFDYIMKGMGFETENETNGPVKKENAKSKKVALATAVKPINKFQSLNDILPTFTENNIADRSASYAVASSENGVNISKNVIVYTPKNQSDVKNLVDFLRRKEPIIVNFSSLDNELASAMISFISGALYALKGSIHPIASELYLLTPEGVNILVPKEK